jgi:NADPH2:quinone reductase
VDLPVPEPGPGQVRVAVSAGSLNFNDIDRCYGRVTTIPMPPPFTLGMDVCGTVDAVGEGADAWMGKRVVAITQMAQGGLAEYALAPVDSVFDAPPELDDAEATSFVIPYHTVHLALFERAGLCQGEGLLVISGASGLGTAAIQLGLACGARVFATAGGPEKVALCRELGAELAVDHLEANFADAVLDHTADVGAEVVLDLAGGGFVADAWRAVARGGRYIAGGFADDPANGTGGAPLRPTCIGNFSIVGVIGAYMSNLPAALRRAGFNPFGRDVADSVHADLLGLVASGKVRPHVGQRVALAEAPAALEAHEQRRSLGRTAVLING